MLLGLKDMRWVSKIAIVVCLAGCSKIQPVKHPTTPSQIDAGHQDDTAWEDEDLFEDG
jgi:hypothetical protein